MFTISPAKRTFLTFCCALILITGCKKDSNPADPGEAPAALTAEKNSLMHINDFNLSVTDDGSVQTADVPFPVALYSNGKNTVFISSSGLWTGTDNGTPLFNAVRHNSNFTPYWDTVKAGVYHVTGAMTGLTPPQSLSKLGFPVSETGKVKLYGDEMCWSAHQGKSIPGDILFSSPLPGIRVTQAVFGYRRADLKNVLFIRYEIKNISSSDINNIYTAYWSDTDLGNVVFNSTGYDYASSLTYTYEKKLLTNDSSLVAGFSFIASPYDNPQYPNGVSSHRIMRKNSYINPEFGEYGFGSQQAIHAMKGLSNKGEPMIDPITKQATQFAFTGDPASGTGWIDNVVDTRNMISAGPLNLKSQETRTLVVLWLFCGGNDFSTNLSNMKSQLDKIRKEPSLWK